jgi:hypothetical protein
MDLRSDAHRDLGLAPAAPPPDVSAYLAATGRIHDWLLDALGEATASLGTEGHLPEVAAEQSRLLRQFLDAQRSITRYWAEVDAELLTAVDPPTSPAESSDESSAESTAAAHLVQVRHHTHASHGGTAVAVEHRIGTAVADAVRPERELRALLDQWWHREHAAGRAALAARASGSDGRCEAPAVVSERASDPLPPPTPAAAAEPAAPTALEVAAHWSLPSAALVRSCDRLDPADLLLAVDGLLAQIAATPSVTSSPVEADPVDLTTGAASDAPHDGDGVVPALPLPVLPPAPAVPAAQADDPFDRFWTVGRSEPAGRSLRDRPFVQALLPLTSMFVVLALVLAWIG